MPWKPDIVLYHKNCNDGFGAAWAAWKAWGDQDMTYEPVAYGDAPINLRGRNVLVADVTYKKEELRHLAITVGSMVILDHHMTAMEQLSDWQIPLSTKECTAQNVQDYLQASREQPYPVVALFDMSKSGAHMTWEFAHYGGPTPLLIDYIEDHDLWKHALSSSLDVSAALDSYRHDFDIWNDLSLDIGKLQAEGRAINRYKRRLILDLIPKITPAVLLGHTNVPILNLPPQMASLAGHTLLAKFPDAPFAATFWKTDLGEQWSLRSEDSRENVGEIAKAFGGGGHRNAAGFFLSDPQRQEARMRDMLR